jgi:hypothetical protein
MRMGRRETCRPARDWVHSAAERIYMPTLVERIAVAPRREKVIEDCCHLIDAQVKAKGGLSGIAIKGVYATVKTFKRGFVPSVVNALLDEWLGKLQPYYDKWSGGGGAFSEFLVARSDDVAEDLLTGHRRPRRQERARHDQEALREEPRLGQEERHRGDSGAGPPDREAPGRGRRDPASVTLPATA